MVAVFMMSPKLATLGLIKSMASYFFSNKVYHVIIFIHVVTNKILSPDSNYILDAIMKLKFGNSSISGRDLS